MLSGKLYTLKTLLLICSFLKTLGEIELAFRILQGSDVKNLHPIDAKYHSLKCDLQPIKRDDDNFKVFIFI